MKIEVYSPTIRRKEMDAVLTAMVEDSIGPGEQGRRLVQLVKEFTDCEYCLALRSPAVALAAALAALGLEKDSGVIISALSPRYYLKVIADLELKPIYCDVLPSSACIGPASIETALSRRETGLEARCIVLHHALGFVSDTSAIAEIGIPLIEDCSRSYGTMAGEERVPSLGVFTIVGLEERDMLTAGGGALLYAMNRRDASVLKNLEELPPEYCLPGMNAAMAMVQFKEARRNLEKRQEIARLYIQSSLQTRHERFIQTGNTEYNNYTFPLILKTGMKDVKVYAKRKDIAVENAFEDTVMGNGIVPSSTCPEAYSLSLRTAIFPLYPRLSSAASGRVAKLIGTLP
jgi:dTDP-4-amino-4,6-dideoxygalactose transaminase